MRCNVFLAIVNGLTQDEIINFETKYNQAVAEDNTAKLTIYDKVKIDD